MTFSVGPGPVENEASLDKGIDTWGEEMEAKRGRMLQKKTW